MEEITEFTDLRVKYREALNLVKDLPDYKRIPAENRFLLIREFEDFQKSESKKLGKKFRKMEAIKKFCEANEINWNTFYRHTQLDRKGGIRVLVSNYGTQKGKGRYIDSILPIIRENYEEGKGYTPIYKKLIAICEQKGIEVPSYSTFRRISIANGLSDSMARKKTDASEQIKPPLFEQENKADPIPKRFKFDPPKWLKVQNKRSFNIAIYKYSLVLPFLDPDLDRKEKHRLIDEIVDRKHQPFSGVTITFNRNSILKYISIFKNKGFEGLIRKQHICYVRRYKNILWATFKIDMNDPLASLKQLRGIISKGPNTAPKAKNASLRFLDDCVAASNVKAPKYKPVWLGRQLTDEEIQKLEGYKRRGNENQRRRAVGLLMANDHHTMPEILNVTGRSEATLYRWFKIFLKEGIGFVETKIDRTKNNPELRERKDRIVKILHCQPKDYDINRTSWYLKDITKVYEKDYDKSLSLRSIRDAIKKTNYSWRRAKKVLTSPDPEYREKTKKVLDTLHNLGRNDAFFFIDEGGPYAVKKWGGKSLTPKGTTKVVPQSQKPKGRVLFIGALDALKNQVNLFFITSKNTAAVVTLIKVLFYKYQGYSTLYLTWDCASWHRSKGLYEFLDKLNAHKDGPNIKVVPLPKQAQFLNVIEAVFSGMKRAVILNSDYNSEYEMKAAIIRHFRERNEYFQANPKRAGNKIWDKEGYSLDKIDSGLFKRM